jgi:UDP-N-acetylmuramoylalanine-D-glutamate ligase
MDLTPYQQKKIAILGYGLEGKSTHEFLLNHGILPQQISILDQSTDENYLQ